jgi:hypothetical protein
MITEMITAQSHPFVDLIHTYSFHPFVQYILIFRESIRKKLQIPHYWKITTYLYVKQYFNDLLVWFNIHFCTKGCQGLGHKTGAKYGKQITMHRIFNEEHSSSTSIKLLLIKFHSVDS